MDSQTDIELKAALARIGGAWNTYDWKDTKIIETRWARVTDPLRGLKGDYWNRAEPRDASGRPIIRLLDQAESAAGLVVQKPKEKQFVRELRSQLVAELHPRNDETLGAWFARVAKNVDTNGSIQPFWKALRAYSERFKQTDLAKRALDHKLLDAFLHAIGPRIRTKEAA